MAALWAKLLSAISGLKYGASSSTENNCCMFGLIPVCTHLFETFLNPVYRKMWQILVMICSQMNRKGYVGYNFNCCKL